MLRLTQIVGLPVISIHECKKIGTILNMKLSSNRQKYTHLVIASEDEESVYLLSTKDIFLISSDVVFIKNETLLSVTQDTQYDTLINATVWGLSGKTYGKVADINLQNNFMLKAIICNQAIEYKKIIKYNSNLVLVNDTNKSYNSKSFLPKVANVTSDTAKDIVNIQSSATPTTPPAVQQPLPQKPINNPAQTAFPISNFPPFYQGETLPNIPLQSSIQISTPPILTAKGTMLEQKKHTL